MEQEISLRDNKPQDLEFILKLEPELYLQEGLTLQEEYRIHSRLFSQSTLIKDLLLSRLSLKYQAKFSLSLPFLREELMAKIKTLGRLIQSKSMVLMMVIKTNNLARFHPKLALPNLLTTESIQTMLLTHSRLTDNQLFSSLFKLIKAEDLAHLSQMTTTLHLSLATMILEMLNRLSEIGSVSKSQSRNKVSITNQGLSEANQDQQLHSLKPKICTNL